MNRKIVLLGYVSVLLLSRVGICFQFVKPFGAATTWTVDDDGPEGFHTIQEAIKANPAGSDLGSIEHCSTRAIESNLKSGLSARTRYAIQIVCFQL